jgi:hypothetical protein
MNLAGGEWISLMLHASRRSGGEGHQICGHWGLPVKTPGWGRMAGVSVLRQEMRSTEGVRMERMKRRDKFF